MTYEEIRKSEEINTYIRQADLSLSALGYTEHSFAHIGVVADRTAYILDTPCRLSAKLPTRTASKSTPVMIHGGVIFGNGRWIDD